MHPTIRLAPGYKTCTQNTRLAPKIRRPEVRGIVSVRPFTGIGFTLSLFYLPSPVDPWPGYREKTRKNTQVLVKTVVFLRRGVALLKILGASQPIFEKSRTLWPEAIFMNSKRYGTFFVQATRYNPNSPLSRGYVTFQNSDDFGRKNTRLFWKARPM